MLKAFEGFAQDLATLLRRYEAGAKDGAPRNLNEKAELSTVGLGNDDAQHSRELKLWGA